MEIMIVMGNPASRVECKAMYHICGEGILDMFGDVLGHNMGVMEEVILEGKDGGVGDGRVQIRGR
jgi:hypothetical protein